MTLEKAKVKAFAYNTDEPMEFAGKFEALVETKKRYTTSTFYVTNHRNSGCLLSVESVQDLKLVRLHLIAVSSPAAHKIQPTKVDTKDQQFQEIVNLHSNVITRVGKFKDNQIKLNIYKEVVPIAQPQ